MTRLLIVLAGISVLAIGIQIGLLCAALQTYQLSIDRYKDAVEKHREAVVVFDQAVRHYLRIKGAANE